MAGMADSGDDSTFELNLAPMLDIIVSIVPMLLLSVAFVHVTVIDTPVPQAVEKAIAAANEKNKDQIQVTLAVSSGTGYRITINNHGESKETFVAMKGADFDLDGLHREVMTLKKEFPDVFRLELHPDGDVPLKEIVAVMDAIRTTAKGEAKLTFRDVESGKPIETNLLFPDVVFGNVAGG
jgi:biopolymer transport protein ExbD